LLFLGAVDKFTKLCGVQDSVYNYYALVHLMELLRDVVCRRVSDFGSCKRRLIVSPVSR